MFVYIIKHIFRRIKKREGKFISSVEILLIVVHNVRGTTLTIRNKGREKNDRDKTQRHRSRGFI
jgi:hypothetical protein